jgi:8-oxo-dGTP diphosphatase
MGYIVHVVAGVVRNLAGEFLLAQRLDPPDLAGLWEFAGGKLEQGESRFQALQRELLEELGIYIHRATPLIQLLHRYPHKHILLDVWEVTEWSGSPEGREGQAWGWFPLSMLRQLKFPAANHPIINALHLPKNYLITPEPNKNFFEELTLSLQQGIQLMQFRAKTLSETAYQTYALEAIRIAHQHDTHILLNSTPDIALSLGADGVHLNSQQLYAYRQKPKLPWVAASCHHPRDIEYATRLGIDFMTISPVQPTMSHPEQNALGWEEFSKLAQAATCPVFALGGMQLTDIASAREHGAQGIAAIRGLWKSLP